MRALRYEIGAVASDVMQEGFATTGKVLRPDQNVVAERVHDELVIVHLGTNRIYALNRTAGRAWELFAEGIDRAEIRERLLTEFAVEGSEFDAEIEAFFSSLASEGLARTDAE